MSEKSEFPSERRMSFTSEAATLLRDLAEPRPVGDSTKAALRRLARALKGWKASRLKDLWYSDPRVRLRAEEIDQLRSLKSARGNEAARDEIEQLRARVARLEKILGRDSASVAG